MKYRALWMALLAVSLSATLGCPRAVDIFLYRTAPTDPVTPGVVFYDRLRAEPGFNIVNIENMRTCDIFTMDGLNVARLPGGFCLFLPDGQYFSVTNDLTLLDRDFSVLWSLPGGGVSQHHDVTYDPARDWIWYLTSKKAMVDGHASVLTDVVKAIERKTGKEVFTWGTLENRGQIEAATGKKLEVLFNSGMREQTFTHVNSLSVVPAGAAGAGHPGNFLLSEDNSGFLLMVDVPSGRITWSWEVGGGGWMGQHSAQYLPTGNILFFANNKNLSLQKYDRKFSIIGEVDTLTKQLASIYTTQPLTAFYAEIYGNVQKLARGNLLITHIAHGGAAFEVTPSGRLVWEWNNPAKDAEGKPAKVYRVKRISAEVLAPYLDSWQRAGLR